MIPYGRQDITQDDIDAVTAVLRSDFLTQGPAVPRFEQAVARYCGATHALAVNSATSALHLACLALGLGPGDWLWTSPITFVASANCALYCGAQVDFVDIDPRTWNLCPLALERKLLQAEQEGRLPKVVVAVHLCGQPCELATLRKLADRFGFRIIEDASHAIGARYRGEPVGNCRYSDITVFSFHPVKIITTAEGGMLLTNDAALAERLALLRSHGITRDPAQMTQMPDGPWYYEQIALGFNYRMTDLHLYVVRLEPGQEHRHRQVFEGLRTRGIGVNLHYIPVYRQPYYRQLGQAGDEFPEAERYYAQAISLPLYATLAETQQDAVVAALRAELAA